MDTLGLSLYMFYNIIISVVFRDWSQAVMSSSYYLWGSSAEDSCTRSAGCELWPNNFLPSLMQMMTVAHVFSNSRQHSFCGLIISISEKWFYDERHWIVHTAHVCF